MPRQCHYVVLLLIAHCSFGCFAQQNSMPVGSPITTVLPSTGPDEEEPPVITAPPSSLSSSPPLPLPSPSPSPSLSPSPSSSPSSSFSSSPSPLPLPSLSTANSSGLPTSTDDSPALSTSSPSGESSSSSRHNLPIILGIVLGILGLLFLGFVARLYLRRKNRPKSEAWTAAVANPLLDPYHDTSYGRPSEDFNPWSGLPDSARQQPMPGDHQERHSPVHATISLSTIMEKSKSMTINSNQLPLGSPLTSHSPIELSNYSPRLGRSGSVDQLSYTSDLPPGAAAAGDPHQYPPSPTSLRGPITGGARNVQPGNLKPEKKSSLVVFNRTDDEQEDLVPPYSL